MSAQQTSRSSASKCVKCGERDVAQPGIKCQSCLRGERRLAEFDSRVPKHSRGFTLHTYATDDASRAALDEALVWLNRWDRADFEARLRTGNATEDEWQSWKESESPLCPSGPLYIYGDRGRGKTTLAYALAREYVREYGSESLSYWVNVDRALRDRDFDSSLFSDDDGIVVLDDLGHIAGTDRARERVSGWITDRYEAGGLMIVTTNHAPADLAIHLAPSYNPKAGEVLVSRLMDGARRIKLDGPDRRLGGVAHS